MSTYRASAERANGKLSDAELYALAAVVTAKAAEAVSGSVNRGTAKKPLYLVDDRNRVSARVLESELRARGVYDEWQETFDDDIPTIVTPASSIRPAARLSSIPFGAAYVAAIVFIAALPGLIGLLTFLARIP